MSLSEACRGRAIRSGPIRDAALRGARLCALALRRAAPLVAAALACASCANDWRTDMWFQPGGGEHAAARPEPEGSVPLGARAHFDERDDALLLVAPFASDAASVARGRTLFVERCASCHGPEGHGGGPVGRFFPPAPDLGYPVIQAHPDGYLYATVLLGGRAMPPMSQGLDETDLWDLVHFLRTVKAKGTP